MIIKLTEDKDIFMMMDSPMEVDWYNTQKTVPLGLSIIISNHINDISEEFYKDNIGNQLWVHFKK